MANSPRLAFPYIAESQNSKYITHNGALDRLDALVQTVVIDRDLTSPPGSPAEGNMYIVGGSPSRAWSGHANHLTEYIGATWVFYTPAEGWKAWIADEDLEAVFDGAAWVTLADPGGAYTDEQAQDAVGGILTDGATVDLTYNDAGPSITAEVKDNSIDEGHLTTSVAGAGLTGGNGTALAVQVDNATIEISSDTLRLKSGALSGQAGKDIRVNAGETAIEYYSPPYDVGGSYAGTPTANLVILRYPFPRAVVFPASLTLSRGVAGTAPSAQTDFDCQRNGVSFGTMRFANGATTATFISASGASFAAGDILTVVAPAALNGIADLGFALVGTR